MEFTKKVRQRYHIPFEGTEITSKVMHPRVFCGNGSGVYRAGRREVRGGIEGKDVDIDRGPPPEDLVFYFKSFGPYLVRTRKIIV